MQPEGGSISFLEGYDKSQLRLAYVNGSGEYVIFDPDSDERYLSVALRVLLVTRRQVAIF